MGDRWDKGESWLAFIRAVPARRNTDLPDRFRNMTIDDNGLAGGTFAGLRPVIVHDPLRAAERSERRRAWSAELEAKAAKMVGKLAMPGTVAGPRGAGGGAPPAAAPERPIAARPASKGPRDRRARVHRHQTKGGEGAVEGLPTAPPDSFSVSTHGPRQTPPDSPRVVTKSRNPPYSSQPLGRFAGAPGRSSRAAFCADLRGGPAPGTYGSST